MPIYEGVIVVKYYQKVEVEADNQKEAELTMLNKFDVMQAEVESEVYDIWEKTK
jgi:hypothetical protein